MKTKTIFQKTAVIFAMFIFIVFAFSACSSDDSSDEQTDFEPITLNLTGLDIDVDDTVFSLSGYNFNVYRADVTNCDGCYNGIGLAYGINGISSYLELDLSSVNGISKISISLHNNSHEGDIIIQTLDNNNNVLQKLNDSSTIPNGPTNVSLNNISTEISKLKISASEAIISSIRLE